MGKCELKAFRIISGYKPKTLSVKMASYMHAVITVKSVI